MYPFGVGRGSAARNGGLSDTDRLDQTSVVSNNSYCQGPESGFKPSCPCNTLRFDSITGQ